jgi:hypothetical protein
MICAVGIEHYGTDTNVSQNLKTPNMFFTGCANFIISDVTDHETSKSHATEANIMTAKSRTPDTIRQSTADTHVIRTRH